MIINEGQRLIFSPGAELYLDPAVHIKVGGDIIISGTDEEPVKLLAMNDELGWKGMWIRQVAGQFKMEHTVIRNGLILSTAPINHVSHCTFENSRNLDYFDAVLRLKGREALIRNCSTYSNQKGEGFLIHEAIDPIVEDCYFYKTSDAVELISATNGIVANNLFEKSGGDAIDLNHCNGTIIENNFINQTIDCAIEISSEGFGPCSNLIIRRNIFARCDRGVLIRQGSNGLFENNTIYDSRIAFVLGGETNFGAASQATIINTIFMENETTITANPQDEVTVHYSLSKEVLLDGIGNIMDDPLLKAPMENDFQLMEASPCIDAGSPDSPFDPDGTRVDIGAFYFE